MPKKPKPVKLPYVGNTASYAADSGGTSIESVFRRPLPIYGTGQSRTGAPSRLGGVS